MRFQDVSAGLAVAGLLLPEAVAYSAIAGLPPGRAITAGLAGIVAYAALGQSRFAILTPTSSAAAILAATLAAMTSGGGVDGAALATGAVLLTGVMFLAAAALGLGGLTSLIPHPVLRGFAFGIALTIIVRQLPAIAGVAAHAPDPLRLLLALAGEVAAWSWISIALGVAALALFFALKRLPGVPGALIVLALGVALSFGLGLAGRGVAMVGPLSVQLAVPSLPLLPPEGWARLASYVLPMVLILFAESWGTISGLAVAHGDRVSANRELVAVGAANLASALVHGMPVGAGFSAGAAAEASGAQSRGTALAAAAGLAGLVLLARPLVAALPLPVLAAVVVGTLAHGLSPAPFVRLWRLGRDLPLALAAAAAVMGFGVLNGMLAAVALSLGATIHRLTEPRLARLGRLGDSRNFVDLARHPEAAAPPGVGIWRPSEPLFFGNAAAILDRIGTEARARADLTALVVSLEETFDLDSTAYEALVDFERAMADAGRTVWLARVHDHVRDVLVAGGQAGLLGRCTYSVDDAVTGLEAHGEEQADAS